MVTTTSSKTLSLKTYKVIQEINWSLLVSISVHGLFFTLILPQWNPRNNSEINLGDTPVVELNDIEQTRLPNLNPRNSFNWDTLKTLPPSDNLLPPLSAINIPLPPVNNTEFFVPSFDSGTITNLPAPPSLPPATNLPPINYSYNVDNLPTPKELPAPPPLNENTMATLPLAINDDNLSTNFIPSTTGKVGDIDTDPQREAEIRQKLFANSDVEIISNPRDLINGKIPQTYTQKDSRGNIIIIQPSEVRPNYTSISSKLQKQVENTSDEEARKNYVAWAKEVQSITPKQLTFTGIYPKDACVGKLEGTTTYGVTVNPSGGVINTQLIKSSGYPLLNDQALKQIRSRNFANDSGSSQPYHVYVNFKYDSQICPSLSVPNVGETPATNSVKPAEVNTPAINNIQRIIKTPSATPKPETQENKPSKVSIPQTSQPIQSFPEPKPVIQKKDPKNVEVELPAENKSESLMKPPAEKSPVENKSESLIKPPVEKSPVENKSESLIKTPVGTLPVENKSESLIKPTIEKLPQEVKQSPITPAIKKPSTVTESKPFPSTPTKIEVSE